MTVVNEVGVDPNRLLEHPHTVALLQFVCGLGPRKATSLLKVHFFVKITVNWVLSVADPGEGSGPPFIFRPNIDPQGRRKIFLRPGPPLSQCLDDRPPRTPSFPPPKMYRCFVKKPLTLTPKISWKATKSCSLSLKVHKIKKYPIKEY